MQYNQSVVLFAYGLIESPESASLWIHNDAITFYLNKKEISEKHGIGNIIAGGRRPARQ
jgi:hypothetical protein